MHDETTDHGRKPDSETTHRVVIPAEALSVGDTVVWTSRLNKEYRYRVADIDGTWITFQTGVMVHRDRFEREAFEVVRESEVGTSSTDETDDRRSIPDAKPGHDDEQGVPRTPAARASTWK